MQRLESQRWCCLQFVWPLRRHPLCFALCCAFAGLQGIQSNVETHGFTHHQKTAIVDRTGSDGRRHLVVFSGGLDLTQRMTDSSDHPLENWRGSAYSTSAIMSALPSRSIGFLNYALGA